MRSATSSGCETIATWLAATSIHVLARLARMSEALRARYRGLALRLGLVAATLVAGVVVGISTLPVADHLQDQVSAPFGVDAR